MNTLILIFVAASVLLIIAPMDIQAKHSTTSKNIEQGTANLGCSPKESCGQSTGPSPQQPTSQTVIPPPVIIPPSNTPPPSTTTPPSTPSCPSGQSPDSNGVCVQSVRNCSSGFTLQPDGTCVNSSIPPPPTQTFTNCPNGVNVPSQQSCAGNGVPNSSTSGSNGNRTKTSPTTTKSDTLSSTDKSIMTCFNASSSNISDQYIAELGHNIANLSALQNGTPFNAIHTELAAFQGALKDCLTGSHPTTIVHHIAAATVIAGHTKDFLTGYKLGKQDASVGVFDIPGSCGPAQHITNTIQCASGYTIAYNKFCGPISGSKFPCNS